MEIDERIYNHDDLIKYCEYLCGTCELVRKNNKVSYYNIPAAFDIETSSFLTPEGEKQATMYLWQFGINGKCTVGRTWYDFQELYFKVCEALKLGGKLRLIIYVHNLDFEFQFMRKWLNWQKVFAIDKYKPLYAITRENVEFRCSYKLSGYKLATVAKNLLNYKINKLDTLDYNLLRHSETELEPEELQYAIYDILIVMCYIQELIEREGGINRIPLTQTGFVRDYCKSKCYPKIGKYKNDWHKYRKYIINLTLTPEQFRYCRDALMGGFVHGSVLKVGKVYHDVGSRDIASSYPYEMLSEFYPSSKPIEVDPEELQTLEELQKIFKRFCCIFEIEFYGLEASCQFENIISFSKCKEYKNVKTNNGRVIEADYIKIVITNIDFEVFQKYYTFKSFRILKFYKFYKSYLPKQIIECIIHFFTLKTELKGVEGQESEYLNGKEKLNSTYGMAVTNPVKPLITYLNGIWGVDEEDTFENLVEKNNKSFSRFLYYPWGIFVTSYARREVLEAIHVVGSGGDYIYSDTDSIKFTNPEKYSDFFNQYNEKTQIKLQKMCDFYDIPYENLTPKNKKGEKKYLGIYEYECTYKRYKTLGAKRYMYENDEGVFITIAGLGKKQGIEYIKNICKEKNMDVFEFFDNNMYIPPEGTGKLTHTYIDELCKGVLKDYQGKEAEYMELSAVNLSPCDFTLSLDKEYAEYLLDFLTDYQ